MLQWRVRGHNLALFHRVPGMIYPARVQCILRLHQPADLQALLEPLVAGQHLLRLLLEVLQERHGEDRFEGYASLCPVRTSPATTPRPIAAS